MKGKFMNRNTLSLGDRMKKYEEVIDFKLNPCMQYMIRLDGKGFSKMIKKWKCGKPFDERFNKAMNYAARKLFDFIPNIKLAWHGSDEISIWFAFPNVEDMYYDGRIQKLVSLTASQASVYFNKKLQELFEDNTLPFGIFDARIMQFPNEEECWNCLLFRQRDHIRNSISGYAQFYFSHKELTGKNSDEKIEMMKEFKGFDQNELREELNWSKYGTFLKKELVQIVPNTDKPYLRHVILEKSRHIDLYFTYFAGLEHCKIGSYSEDVWRMLKAENE